ncbi:RdgB/HAM1 family non-canonical purine NTP pyrophosphatase [bacterium]|nr:RdgB/HAM1 family non-canonical purine NTP pyrophosphatase [bacterium]
MLRPLADCRELIIATSNPNKVRELSRLLAGLGILLHALPTAPPLQPIVEDGTTLRENARKKAIGYATQLGKWVLADDTGLEVDALDSEPGVRSARYAGDEATMAENRALLLKRMANIPGEQRTARFVCHLCVAAPNGTVALEATGQCRGKIGFEPAGQFGFGYDTLFVVEGANRTLAEHDEEATATVGHRGQAARALIESWQSRG